MDEQRLDKAKADGSNPFSSTNLYDNLEYSFTINNFRVPLNTKGITNTILLEFFASGGSSHGKPLGYSAGGFSSFINKVFPNKPKGVKYKSYLLSLINKKHCTKCNKVLPLSEYHSNSGRYDGVSTYCNECERASHKISMPSIQAKRRASKLQRTPKWCNEEKIKEIYKKCPENMQVDHIIPLQGKLVSGLHVPENLQYLSPEENMIKGNRFLI